MPTCPPTASRRTFLAAALVAAAVPMGCGNPAEPADPEPRPLTEAEAEQLALVRFSLYDASPVTVAMTWPGSPTSTFTASLDLRNHIAVGTYQTETAEAAAPDGFVAWNLAAVATAPQQSDPGQPPAPDAWTRRAMTPDHPRDLFLILALNLGSDRPENPLLIRQSSAKFLRADVIGDEPVSVFEGPQPSESGSTASTAGTSRTRYWLAEGGTLRRFQAYLGDADGRFATIDIGAAWTPSDGLVDTATTVLAAGE